MCLNGIKEEHNNLTNKTRSINSYIRIFEEKLENEKNLIEKSFIESEKVFRELFDNMSGGVAVYESINDGKDFLIKDFNKAGEKISKVNQKEIIGKKITEIFPGVKELGLFDVLQRVWKTGKSEHHPISQYKDERVTQWVENYVYKLPSGLIVAIFNDVSEQKIAEEKLIDSEIRFKSTFMESPIALTLYDSDGKLLDANKACLDLINVSTVEQIKGFDILDDPNMPRDIKERVLSGETVKFEMEYDFNIVKDTLKPGLTGTLYFDAVINPIHSANNESVDYYLVQVQDITKTKQTEELIDIQNRISQIFLTVPDEEMFPKVLDAVLEVLNSKYGVFGYIDEKSNCVCPSMTRDIWDRCQMEEKNFVFPRETWSGIWGKCLIEKRPVYSNVPLNVPEGHVKIDNALAVPIVFQDKSVGHFNIANKVGGFKKNDIELLKAIANWTAPILHARLQRDIQEEKRKMVEEDLKKLNKELELRIEDRAMELRDSEIKYRALFEQAGDMIIVLDTETGDIVDFNDKMHENLGYTREEFNDVRVSDFDMIEEDEDYQAHIKKIINEGFDFFETKYRTKSGEVKDILIHAKAIKIKEKTYLHSIMRDITKMKDMDEKLKESEEKFRKAYYQANLYRDIFAHDINNILQNIHSSAELSSLYLNNPEKLHTISELYEIIREQVERGTKLIKNVRKINEIDESEVELEKIEAIKLLKNAVTFLKNSFQARILDVTINNQEKQVFVLANNLLLDVFENILINAVRHNISPKIDISIDISEEKVEEKNYIRMEFKDNGIGISDYRKKSIFEKGTRKSQKSKGMGLGLSLVKKIIDSYSGDIWVEDRVKGEYKQGSNFVILLQEA